MIQLATILPALLVAHLLGAVLLLYSLEKVLGIVSKTRRRFASRLYKGVASDLGAADGVDAGSQPVKEEDDDASHVSEHSFSSSQGKAALVQCQPISDRTEPWSRGCSCQVS